MLMKEFMNKHIQYPRAALKRGEQGTVRITFETDRKGKVIKRSVSQSVSPTVDSAALSLFDLILWEPATYYGKPKNGNGEFKIKYNISKYQSLVKKRGYDIYELPYFPVDSSLEVFGIKDLDKTPDAILDSNYKSIPEFIGNNLEFPDAAAKLNIEGDVKLKFVIEANGLPSNITVMQTVGGGCTEEAIRILNLIEWMPGVHENMAVRTCYYLTIHFDAAEELKNKYIPNQTSSGI
jgi:TonB family protein